MTSFIQKLFNTGARYGQKPVLDHVAHQPTLGRILDATSFLTIRRLKGCEQRFTFLPDFRMRRMIPAGTGDNLLLYFHGGGFTIGSSFSHRWLAARIAAQIDAQAWVVDYRLAPEHPYPAAPDDCLAAYKHALKTYSPDRIVVAGDSAGGCLALNLVTRLHAAGLPQPAALALMSPVTDLSGSFKSRETFHDTDMLLPPQWIDRCIPAYLGGLDPKDPDISPAFADLSMAPPTALHVAEGEILFDDTADLAEKIDTVDYHTWDNVPHVWQLAAGWTKEADESLYYIAQHLNTHLP